MTSHNEIQPFIRCDQFNFIKFQVKHLVHAHSTVKDPSVLKAVKYGAVDKIMNLFPEIEEHQIFDKIAEIEEDIQAKNFLADLKTYVIPFKPVTEKTVGKLFPKAGKLKLQFLKEIDFTETTYLGWYDIRSDKKFLIFDYKGKLMGIHGTFRHKTKGICSLCNRHGEVGLFMANVKSGKETFTNRGNYICDDSQECNRNLQSLDRLEHFIENLKN
ncbi:FusB/FusC family EF-G-binding protein [Siminovitchia fortis]|uniref:Elongation factor G-binding protein n=1 Tax=Siminovitchia fortis TaxID=254758 RepID=A0A443ITV2_9BACI|nr:FusB/FusC family EF-G-binding protein [Siminovitchia fortis]RWR11120.1 elongation factor G-binding protein [Siminovitchia fortis]WHY82476.1 FusB/FusC family EF-G-binding protein [Siminovitchia fortis]